MKVKVVICDHGSLASGNDAAHVYSVLKGIGYKVKYVSRSYESPEDIRQIASHRPTVILADPSVHKNGRQVDLPFLRGLEKLCERGPELVLFALEPSELGVEGILEKTNHPLIIESIVSYVKNHQSKTGGMLSATRVTGGS